MKNFEKKGVFTNLLPRLSSSYQLTLQHHPCGTKYYKKESVKDSFYHIIGLTFFQIENTGMIMP